VPPSHPPGASTSRRPSRTSRHRAPRYGIPLLKVGDAIAPTVGVGIAIARIGCFLEGCCYGTVCHLPWCLAFPRDAFIFQVHSTAGLIPADATSSAPAHPLQLYFAIAGLLVTSAALLVHPRKAYDGQPALVTLLVCAVLATALEALRGGHPGRVYWGRLPHLAWIGIALTAASGALLVAAERAHGWGRLPLDAVRQQERDDDGQHPVKGEAI